jgi:hypothetical protein
MGGDGGGGAAMGVMRWQPLRLDRRRSEARLNLELTGSLPVQEVSATKLIRQAGAVVASGKRK